MTKNTSINDVNEYISQSVEDMLGGRITPSTAKIVINAANKILATTRLEMAYAKSAGRTPEIEYFAHSAREKTRARKAEKNDPMLSELVSIRNGYSELVSKLQERTITPCDFKRASKPLNKRLTQVRQKVKELSR